MKSRIITSILAIALLSSCQSNSNASKDEASVSATQEEAANKTQRKIVRKPVNIPSEFSYITNIGSVDIIFSHGDYNMEVEGDSALIEYIKTNFDSNLLTISLKSDANTDYNMYGNANNTKLYITAPQLQCVSICNTGNFECTDTWQCDDIQIGILGTGGVKLNNVECKTFLIDATGKGNVSIDHLKADVATLNSRSSGTFNIDCDVNDFTIINDGEQTINLTGKVRQKSVSNKEDKKLNDQTE